MSRTWCQSCTTHPRGSSDALAQSCLLDAALRSAALAMYFIVEAVLHVSLYVMVISRC